MNPFHFPVIPISYTNPLLVPREYAIQYCPNVVHIAMPCFRIEIENQNISSFDYVVRVTNHTSFALSLLLLFQNSCSKNLFLCVQLLDSKTLECKQETVQEMFCDGPQYSTSFQLPRSTDCCMRLLVLEWYYPGKVKGYLHKVFETRMTSFSIVTSLISKSVFCKRELYENGTIKGRAQ